MCKVTGGCCDEVRDACALLPIPIPEPHGCLRKCTAGADMKHQHELECETWGHRVSFIFEPVLETMQAAVAPCGELGWATIRSGSQLFDEPPPSHIALSASCMNLSTSRADPLNPRETSNRPSAGDQFLFE